MTLDDILHTLIQDWVMAVVILAFVGGGIWVLAARPSALLNRAMGAFLLLYGGSSVAYQALREARLTGASSFEWVEALMWFELAFPFLTGLVLLALFAPGRRSRAHRAIVWGLAGAMALTAITHLLLPRVLFHAGPGPDGAWALREAQGPLAMVIGLLWVVAQIAVILFGALAAGDGGRPALQRRQAALIGLAYAFPFGPQALSAGFDLVTGSGRFWATTGLQLLYNGLALAGLPIVAWAWTRFPAAFRGRARAIVAWASILTAAVASYEWLASEGLLPWARFQGLRPVWLGALAVTHVIAAIQFDMAGSGHARRRAVRRSVVVLSTLGLFVGIPLGLALVDLGVRPYGLAGMGAGAVLVAALAGPWLARSGRAALDGGPATSWTGHRIDDAVGVYREALAGLVGPDRVLPPGLEPTLAALRSELGLSDRDHDIVLASLGPAADAATPRVLLGRYIVERELGRGGSAIVYRARDAVHGRTVVLKRFHVNAAARRTFLQELRTLSTFRDPRVLAVFDAEEVGNDLILVLEHVDGASLQALLDEEGPVDAERACALTLRVLDALSAVHRGGYLHGDVKPANVLIDQDGQVKLGDFGTARLVDTDPDLTRTLQGGAGTLSSMAPEQMLGRPRSPATDTYAAATLLYRLLTGEHYLDLSGVNELLVRQRIVEEPPRLPHPKVPAALEELLQRALAKDPSARYASADAMAGALRRAAARLEVGTGHGGDDATAAPSRIHRSRRDSRPGPTVEGPS